MYVKLLLIITVLFAILSLYSCSSDEDADNDGNQSSEGGASDDGTVLDMPPIGEDGFADIVYSLPDVEEIKTSLLGYKEEILLSELDYSRAVEICNGCIGVYNQYETMLAHAEIRFSKNKMDADARGDFTLLYENLPMIRFLIGEIFMTVGEKEYASSVEKAVSNESLFNRLRKSGIPNIEAAELLTKESKLKAELLGLSTATVPISYEGITASLDETLTRLKELYGEDSSRYESAMKVCLEKYERRLKESHGFISIEIIKLRYILAEELGYESYSHYLYGNGFPYSSADTAKYVDAVYDYTSPVYSELSQVFARYFYSTPAPKESTTAINQSLYELYKSSSGDLCNLFAHMLSGELYSIEEANEHRRTTTFSSYLSELNSPYLFASVKGDITDYQEISREFGRFFGSYVNQGSYPSYVKEEIAAEGLRLLTLASLSGKLSGEEYKYLLYSELNSIFNELKLQCFYSRLENEIYSLHYSQIDKENISRICTQIAGEMGLSESILDRSVQEELICSPFRAQSRCAALITALELFFAEIENEGTGYNKYLSLIGNREAVDIEALLLLNGLSGIKKNDIPKRIADMIYYHINGYHYYDDSSADSGEA